MVSLNKIIKKGKKKMKISMYATANELCNYLFDNGYYFIPYDLVQIYALYEIAKWKRSEIAKYMGYAPSTISNKRSQMWEYEEIAKKIFIEFEEATKEEEPKDETVKLYRTFKDNRPTVVIEIMSDCEEKNIENEQAVYFFKFYNYNNELEFNKIGTTAKNVIGRLRDEIGDYSKKYDIGKVEVHRMRKCGNYPAEGAESLLRAELIRRYPEAFRKNDRFFGVDISPKSFDEILEKYFN